MIFARGPLRPRPGDDRFSRNAYPGGRARVGFAPVEPVQTAVDLHTVKSVSIQRSGSDRARWTGNLLAVLTVDEAGQMMFGPE